MEDTIKKAYMMEAISLAKQGEGSVNPNPLVGAVIVKNGRIIGKGYHEKYGSLHAERNALASCTENLEDAELYVTLEPCCHYGKTPPCTEAIVQAGISKVYVGSKDPNPLVAGKGIQFLRAHGIFVEENVCRQECDTINAVFFHYIQNKTPYVVMKYAMTMDGKIATVTGASQWVTGDEARLQVQKERNKYMGIMVGINTVLADDPMLSCRIEGGRNPIRIICDTKLRTPMEAQIVKSAKGQKTILATAETEEEKRKAYEAAGCEILTVKKKDGHLDLQDLMKKLGNAGIDSILLEGGADLNASALKQGIVKEVHTYVAPKLFGGKEAKTPIAGEGVLYPKEAYPLKIKDIKRLGEDYLIQSEVSTCSQE